MKDKIDFVITWVDGNDPVWKKERDHYAALEHREIDNNSSRYRDWETLKYWFRGVEKFAPWVNKVFFVTWGHVPAWLDTSNPKLQIVKHEEFIPTEYLPTYNSNVIEFYFHKIKGLSEHFVYFNDDMLLLDSTAPDRFFRNGLPCDKAVIATLEMYSGMYGCSVFRANDLVNKHIDKRTAIRENLLKWYYPLFPKSALHNLIFYRHGKFPGFYSHHLPQGYLKQTYMEVWKHCEKEIEQNSRNKFRAYEDVAPWLLRFWQLASGYFVPYDVNKDGKFYSINDCTLPEITDCIRRQKARLVCLNDYEGTDNYDIAKKEILGAFNEILPEKSGFELFI